MKTFKKFLNAKTFSPGEIAKKHVIVHGPDNSNPDGYCPLIGEPHCNPKTATGAASVFCYP